MAGVWSSLGSTVGKLSGTSAVVVSIVVIHYGKVNLVYRFPYLLKRNFHAYRIALFSPINPVD